jgi:hypothetical protein
MTSSTTVLGLLRKARDLVSTGRQAGIIEAISSLQAEASGPLRDLAYFALLDTASLRAGNASLSALASSAQPDDAIELFDATIKRIASKLH